MVKKTDSLSIYYVNILEHVLLLLKQISREQNLKLKKIISSNK